MARFQVSLPAGRRLVALDVGIAIWAASWLGLGLWVADEARGLTRLSDTVVRVGTALKETGATVNQLDSLPLVGDAFKAPAQRIGEAGESASRSGRRSRESVSNLSTLLGFAIALIPSVPLLVLYLPLRVSLLRERRALLDAWEQAGDDPRLHELLARRAVANVSMAKLRKHSPRPWEDLERGRYDRLAGAELARLGIDAAPPSPAEDV